MVEEMISKYPIISEQIDKSELRVILRELERILDADIPGDVVELGCFEGTTSLFIQRMVEARKSSIRFHVYDSFAGLPDKTSEDMSPAGEQFKAGELRAIKQNFIRNFRKSGLNLPVIHKGWFDELPDTEIPNKIAFAFLDGDFYSSIKDSLRLIETKLAPGAIVIIDDYQSEALPGASRATDEWARARQLSIRTEASLAILTNP